MLAAGLFVGEAGRKFHIPPSTYKPRNKLKRQFSNQIFPVKN